MALDIRQYRYSEKNQKYEYGNNNKSILTDEINWKGTNIVGKEINGVVYTDISTHLGKGLGGYTNAFTNLSESSFRRLMANGDPSWDRPLDLCNKGLGILFINWNGAIIENGNLENGNDKVISDSSEFLSIFNKLCTLVYNNIVVENSYTNKLNRSYVTTVDIAEDVNHAYHVPNTPALGNKEVWDIIYINTNTENEVTITVPQNSSHSDNSAIPEGCLLKVPDGDTLTVVIPVGGYAELNYLRIGNNIYVRGA